MSITIQSSRFGAVEIPDEAVLEFPWGIIGLPGHRWALLARDADSDFRWLHSIDHPDVALPVTNPWLFFPEYAVDVPDDDAQRIGISQSGDADVYVTVRAGEALEDFRANLRAPILIHAGRGYQVLNEAPDAPVQAPMFPSGIALSEPEPVIESSVA